LLGVDDRRHEQEYLSIFGYGAGELPATNHEYDRGKLIDFADLDFICVTPDPGLSRLNRAHQRVL
jgi:hypothetical protein